MVKLVYGKSVESRSGECDLCGESGECFIVGNKEVKFFRFKPVEYEYKYLREGVFGWEKMYRVAKEGDYGLDSEDIAREVEFCLCPNCARQLAKFKVS